MTKQKDAEAATPKKEPPTQQRPPMTDDEKNKALTLLKDPALLFDVLSTAKQSGIVGEEKNLLTLYLVMTSRLLPQPLSGATKGESSAGKSALDETIRRFFPKDEAYYFWSAMSSKNLFYTEKDFKHKMLVIAEANGSEASSYAIRTLLSENRLSYEVVERDERTGKSGTRQIEKEGPTGFLTTTTLPRLHPENETRLITLAIDESEKQTRYNAKVLFEDIFFESLYGIHQNTQILIDAITKLSENGLTSITTRELMDELGWIKSKISNWAKPLHEYDWVVYQGPGKENYYQVGRPISAQNIRLPSLEEMAEQFPELVNGFSVVDPVTGATVRLQAQDDDEMSIVGVSSVSAAA